MKQTTEEISVRFSVVQSHEELSSEVLGHFERHDDKFFPPLSQRGGIDGYLSSFFAMDGRLVLCHAGERLVGVMGFCFDHPQWKTYFQYIAFDADYQGRGLPKAIVDYAIELAVEAGETRIVARTWSTNPVMLRFFANRGFIHFDTIYDDRGEGVHTMLFTKLIIPPFFEQPVRRIGIVGGMGTYSTGNFIKTLTGIPRTVRKEQSLLPFVLVNAPEIPDRTESIYNNTVPEMLASVNAALAPLQQAGISHILFLCFTLHPYIDRLQLPKGVEVISLISIIGRMMHERKGNTLLVATRGTYRNRLFYDFGFVFPDEGDIEAIHKIIMEIKSGADPAYYQERVAGYARKYNCEALVLGCTDLHGMFGFSRCHNEVDIIDPLLELSLLVETARTK